MAKIKIWTKKEDEELLSFIEEGREKGIQVRTLCEEFAGKYLDLTREQVRAHYYQLTNTSYRKKEYKKGSWTIKEDRFLLESIEEKQSEMNKLEIFDFVSSKLDRNPRAVASHYYFLKGQKNKTKIEDLDNFIYNMSNLNVDKLDKIVEKLKEINGYEHKEREILKLKEKNKKLAEKVTKLKNQLIQVREQVETYQVKFEEGLEKNN